MPLGFKEPFGQNCDRKTCEIMEKLNDELLEEIFSYLDVNDLKSAVEVSEKWSSVIKNSRKIGRNQFIFVSFDWDPTKFGADLDEPWSVYVPIEQLKYGRLHVITISANFFNLLSMQDEYFVVNFENAMEALEDYQDNIQSVELVIGHNENKRHYAELSKLLLHFDREKFPLLTRLTASHSSINRISYHKMLEMVPLTELELDMSNIFGTLMQTRMHVLTFDAILRHQTESIQVLKLTGIDIKGKGDRFKLPIDSIISNSKRLNKLKLELDGIEGMLDILKSIKDHAPNNKKWTALSFKNVAKNHQKIVNDILANHGGISSLTFKQQWSKCGILKDSVSNLKGIQYKFPNDNDYRSYAEFARVYLLETYFNDTGEEVTKLIEFLKLCTNLKVLKLQVGKAELSGGLIESLLCAVKTLEEFHMEISYANHPDAVINAFEIIKSNAENLKKLYVEVSKSKIEFAREKMKIFDGTKVQTILVEADTSRDRGEDPLDDPDELEAATCVWEKN